MVVADCLVELAQGMQRKSKIIVGVITGISNLKCLLVVFYRLLVFTKIVKSHTKVIED